MGIENPDLNFDVSDTEVDELMSKFGDEADGPSPMQVEEEVTETQEAKPVETAKAETPKAEAKPEQNVNQEFEFVHNGKPIKAPLSQIIKWAQQGYDYPQKMAEFNKHRESIQALESSYKPIDEWVRANPDKWEKLQAVIQSEKEGYGDLPADHPILQKLNQYDQFINEVKTERETAKTKQEDQELDQEVQSIREKYKDLDWATVDDSGRTREQRVYAHAVENNIRKFKTAFLDLYHEDLLTAAETRAKEQLAANKERQAKSGLLPNKAAPATLSAPKTNGKHYPTTDEILAEMGIK